jgi:hypothetical protein
MTNSFTLPIAPAILRIVASDFVSSGTFLEYLLGDEIRGSSCVRRLFTRTSIAVIGPMSDSAL